MDGQWILTINSAQSTPAGTRTSLPKLEELPAPPHIIKVPAAETEAKTVLKSPVLQSVPQVGQSMTSILKPEAQKSGSLNQGKVVLSTQVLQSVPKVGQAMTSILKPEAQKSGILNQGQIVLSTQGSKSVSGISVPQLGSVPKPVFIMPVSQPSIGSAGKPLIVIPTASTTRPGSAKKDGTDLSKFIKIKEMVNVPESMKSSVTDPVHPTSIVEVATIQGAKGVKTIKLMKDPIENVKPQPDDPIKAIQCYQPVSESGVKTPGKNIRDSLDAMFSESTPDIKRETRKKKGKKTLFGDYQSVQPTITGLEMYDPENKGYLYVEDPSMEKSDPGVITSGHQSLYAHDYWQNESDSDNEVGVDEDTSPDYAPGFDDDTSEDFVPFASKSKSKKRNSSQEHSSGSGYTTRTGVFVGTTDLTDEQRFELGKQDYLSGGRHVITAEKYSNLWGTAISKSIVAREHWKYQMLKEMYQQEPLLEMYLKHRGDCSGKLAAEQQTQIVQYFKLHGGTATARHFSVKFMVLLNEAHIRSLARRQ